MIWSEIDEHLGRREGLREIVVEPAEKVPVGYVITVLDLLMGDGFHRVGFPKDGLVLTLNRPRQSLDELAAIPSGMPLMPWNVVFATAIASALALWLSLRGASGR